MSTNSTFFKPNPDGGFSIRYHHWDGYTDEGLGEFLATVVNTQAKVDWLFGLNCGFSTIMCSKPDEKSSKSEHDEYELKCNHDWPKLFNSPQVQTTYISGRNDPKTWNNNEQWNDLENWAQQYNYMWDGSRWNIILHYGSTFGKSVSVDVASYIKFNQMLFDLGAGEDGMDFSWEFFAKKMKCSEDVAQQNVQEWQALSLNQRAKIFEHCLDISCEENNFVEQLDAWMVNQKLQQSIGFKDVAVKKKKL